MTFQDDASKEAWESLTRDRFAKDLLPRPRPPDLSKEEEEPSAELQAVFGKSVRRRRLQLKWTQGDLAKHSGIAQEELSRIENGQVNLTIKTMSRLARVLDGEVTEMLTSIATLSKDT